MKKSRLRVEGEAERRRQRTVLIVCVSAVVGFGGLVAWFVSMRYASTKAHERRGG